MDTRITIFVKEYHKKLDKNISWVKMQLLTLFDRNKHVYLKMAHLFIKHYQQQPRIMLLRSFSNCLANYPTFKRTVQRLSSFYLRSETRWTALSFTGL